MYNIFFLLFFQLISTKYLYFQGSMLFRLDADVLSY